ncbi:MAG: hypothetical protein R2709_08650 [Marmoricola sp.]
MQAHDHSASPAPSGGADVSVRVGWSDDAPAIAEIQVSAWRATYAEVLPGAARPARRRRDRRGLGAVADPVDRCPQSGVGRAGTQHRAGFGVTGPCPDPDADPIRVSEIQT